jgi:hypothetical protein
VYNIFHTASTPGPADAFRPRTARRLFRRRLRALAEGGEPRPEPARPAERGAPPEPTPKKA